MDIDAIIEKQEKMLRFRTIDLEIIGRICRIAEDKLRRINAPCYIRASINRTVVFSLCLPGASRNNEEWARRKANLAERYWVSSLHAARNMEKKGQSALSAGLDEMDYGISGGSFPILLESGLCIGSITVSGLKGEEDHQMVAESIAEVLDVEIESVV